MALKENLKALRKAKALKQIDLAKLINKTPLTVGRYENGQVSPPLSVLEELAKIYGVSVKDLSLDVAYEKKKYTIEEIKKKFEDEKRFEVVSKELKKGLILESEEKNTKQKEKVEKLFDQALWKMFVEYWNMFLSDMTTKRGTVFWEVFTEMGDIFINGKYNLSPEKKDKILNDMKQYLVFLVAKEKNESEK